MHVFSFFSGCVFQISTNVILVYTTVINMPIVLTALEHFLVPVKLDMLGMVHTVKVGY